ncbi:MAG: Metal dependent phosphohydrolase [Candidatus Uhrbacteria bacterium GW2011_GWD2_41_121]|uniref:Metal dependent phosphohydrolase n=1 Tax=Candidatus Uhrbacteria bacterium GW2011_GWC1_41_20 TaxID=1618983 RepID=A0A0G0XLQ8_9BACT|nr:MAG: Metal dependent phosphohydrolase [Candidatus Uhrbacteria bacterium GW2011_GWE1_39_46]KKR63185.1 MAG: Metal dependent phosphohydrolase [Candidatus Uhrbacteria bacterium GW2011_GWC2_40_450]KKR89511.1 MAG: Metal dependent phosphohydrolase [Candidatus Uhrbacteria bacterium GW2011_GWD2_41_121]KKR94592.1 MAG: Metal dependent phosphohydrolase [Candidatus Uhrbacteria bacterium GW2011_GWD1_41_16]KKR97720.1 MAG: Metal dependent phosphohydrolase [Candidatus Uhrbacteria bacterium GW2011_GWC1_41_20]
MHGGLLIRYANNCSTPQTRVASFVESESRLTWTSLFLQSYPQANIYLVGGTVRDILLGHLPKDIDLVIQGVPADKIERWLTAQGAVRFVGERFGTFKFVPHGCRNQEPMDIALPRTESVGPVHGSGRKDLMIQSDYQISILEDLSRRDFTINAIAFDLGSQELHDPFDGLSDLEAQTIRAVGSPEERFYEDATRILRGLRFACQLRFGIEGETWEAISNNLDLLNNKTISEDGTYTFVIPRDAIGKEFLLGFVAHPVHTLTLWDASGALKQFIPWLNALKSIVTENGITAFDQTKKLLHTLERPSFLSHHQINQIHPNVLIAGLSAFAEDHDHALHLCRQFYLHQFPHNHPARVDCDVVAWLLENMHVLEEHDPAGMRPSAFEKLFCSQKGKQLLCLIHGIELVSSKHAASTQRLHTALQLYGHYCANTYPRLISGSDIINLGIIPGVQFRDLLDKIRDAQLVHKIQTKQDAHQYLKNLI